VFTLLLEFRGTGGDWASNTLSPDFLAEKISVVLSTESDLSFDIGLLAFSIFNQARCAAKAVDAGNGASHLRMRTVRGSIGFSFPAEG
jgi:hypothetical protein